MEKVDIVIIGAGIVGLASAYQLLQKNPALHVKILEKESEPAQHQTGNNSGVIHSGVYYKPGSLKAQNCIAGKQAMLEFCSRFDVPVQKVSKVIVATNKDQLPRLHEIEARGRANGVSCQRIDSVRLKEIEPYAEAVEALSIHGCAIVSYKEVAQKLVLELQRLGATICFNEKVCSVDKRGDSLFIRTTENEHCASFLINCAGLFSDRIARECLGAGQVQNRILPFRGEYYELVEEKRSLVNGLIYPVPDPNFPFLGVHLTRMINGKVEAGPNAVLAFAREGYRKSDANWKDCVDTFTFPGFWKMAASYWRAGAYEMARSLSKRLFLRDLQTLVPAIQERDLVAGGSGIRAQAVTPAGKLVDDFSILEERNMLHVLNAPSPAATACFAIGRHIAERFKAQT